MVLLVDETTPAAVLVEVLLASTCISPLGNVIGKGTSKPKLLVVLFPVPHCRQWGLETYSGGFRTIIPPISFQEVFTVYGSLSTTGSIVIGATRGVGTNINVISNTNTAVNEFWLAIGR